MSVQLDEFLGDQGLQLRKLDEDHLTDWFDCGRDHKMTSWLQRTAHKWQQEDMCTVWALTEDGQPGAVLGFFTLSAHSIVPSNVSKSDRVALPDNGGWMGSIKQPFPATLLGKFAVSEDKQGTGLAKVLMLCAYATHVETADLTGAKFLVLEAQDDRLVDYYRSTYGFVRSSRSGEVAQMYRPTRGIRDDLQAVLTAS